MGRRVRVGRARSRRSASARRAGSCVTASRSTSTATSRPSTGSTRAGSTCHSPRSRQSSDGRSRVADARDPVLRRLAEVLAARPFRSARGEPRRGTARRHHGLRVRHRREPALLRRAARADARRGRGRLLGAAATGSSCASRAARARRRLSREFYEEAGVLVRLETDSFDTFLGGHRGSRASSSSARSRTRTRVASSASSIPTATSSS